MKTKEQATQLLLQLKTHELMIYLISLSPAEKFTMLIHKRQSGDILFKHFMFHHPTLLSKCLTGLNYEQKRELFNIRDNQTETVLESFDRRYGMMDFELSPAHQQTYHTTIVMGAAVRQPSPAKDFRRSLRTLPPITDQPTLLASLQTYRALQQHHPLWYVSKQEQQRKMDAADKLIQTLKKDTVPDTIYLSKSELNALSIKHWLTRRSALVQLYRAFRQAHPQCQFVTNQAAAEINAAHEETKVETCTPAPEQKNTETIIPANPCQEVAPQSLIHEKLQRTNDNNAQVQWSLTLWNLHPNKTKHCAAEEKQASIEISPNYGQ